MEKNLQNEEALKKLKEIAEDIRVCMYCTMEHGSDMASRPMSTLQVEEDGTIWFLSSENTSATQETHRGLEVCLNYASTAKNTYMCVMGTADAVYDKAKIKELWNDFISTWYPDGPDSPGLVLLKVRPASAHYWDNDITRIRILFSYIKAKLTGEAAKATEGDEGRLDL